jgi:FixJ family two-component response regulator
MIAVIDDDESVCRAVKRLVRSIGTKANSFTSGQELLDMLEVCREF